MTRFVDTNVGAYQDYDGLRVTNPFANVAQGY